MNEVIGMDEPLTIEISLNFQLEWIRKEILFQAFLQEELILL